VVRKYKAFLTKNKAKYIIAEKGGDVNRDETRF